MPSDLDRILSVELHLAGSIFEAGLGPLVPHRRLAFGAAKSDILERHAGGVPEILKPQIVMPAFGPDESSKKKGRLP